MDKTPNTGLPAHAGHSVPVTVIILSGDSVTSLAKIAPGGRALNPRSTMAVTPPLHSMEVAAVIPKALIRHALRVFDTGGPLPPKTGEAVIAAILHLRPSLASILRTG